MSSEVEEKTVIENTEVPEETKPEEDVRIDSIF